MDKGDDILIEIIEIFINAVIFTRNLYPAEIFRSRKMYSTSVKISIFPPLNDYISDILKSARELKKSDQLHKVEIILYKDEEIILESYSFEIGRVNLLVKCDENDKYLIQLEEELRTLLLRFDQRLKKLKTIPKNTTFKIYLHTTQSAFVKLTNNSSLQHFPWLSDGIKKMYNIEKCLVPISSFSLANIQIYAEEYCNNYDSK